MNRIALLALSILAILAPRPVRAADLGATAALIAAGSREAQFSVRDAFAAMAGYAWADEELSRLGDQFGDDAVAQWEDMTAFALDDVASKAPATLPPPPKGLAGRALAKALLALGSGPDRTFRPDALVAALIPPSVEGTLAADLAQRFSGSDERAYDRITGQAMLDLARDVGAPRLTLAPAAGAPAPAGRRG